MDFASSVPDFRRVGKGNIRHRMDDIIMLMILGRASGRVGRAEIIEFGRHNLGRFRKMGMLRNGVRQRRLRKKRADRRKGMAEIMRHLAASFTKLIRFLCQK